MPGTRGSARGSSGKAMKQRHTRSHPCPVCGGYDAQPRGSGKRCGGFTSEDGYTHCSRIECDEQEDGGTWAHRLNGACRCGTAHGAVVVEQTAPSSAAIDYIAEWQALERRSLVGERYLQGRGIDPHELREQGDIVRYRRDGNPCVALRDLATGEITGYQYHLREPRDGGSKSFALKGSRCKGAALCGRLAELDPGGVDVAVLCEGIPDTLTARLAFSGCAVFGAPGATFLEGIAAALAKRVRETRGWLLLVADNDDDGVKHGKAAKRAAQRAGLVLDQDLLLVDFGEHKDLNDAWRAGWRWEWPGERGGVA